MIYWITKEEHEAIKKAEKVTRNKRVAQRLKVLMLRYEGKSNPEISEKLDLSADRIRHMVSEFKVSPHNCAMIPLYFRRKIVLKNPREITGIQTQSALKLHYTNSMITRSAASPRRGPSL